MDFAHTRVTPKIVFKIYQTVAFGIPRSFSSSRTVNQRSPSIASRTRSTLSGVVVSEGRPERGSLSTDVRPFLNRLYSFICDAHTFVHKGLLYDFGRLRTTLAEIEAKLDANSLICSFCHF